MKKIIEEFKNPTDKSENWIKYLYFTSEKNYNIEHLKSLKENSSRKVYGYVLRSLEILDSLNIKDEEVKSLCLETIKYMDIAKTGTKEKVRQWRKKGYNLYVHNIGSSQIYEDEVQNGSKIVKTLIKTHGLIGQYLRGEVLLRDSRELYTLIEEGLISKEKLKEVLLYLNECIITAVSKELYLELKDAIKECIIRIVENDFSRELSIEERLIRLNGNTLPDN